MTEQTKLKTNHNIRIVNLATGDNVLCMFGEVRNDEEKGPTIMTPAETREK